MKAKSYTAEQIVLKLRALEVSMGSGKSVQLACKEQGISDKTYYRWRKLYGGLKTDQAKKFKELEKENSRLKRLVADLSLEKAMLQELASGNF